MTTPSLPTRRLIAVDVNLAPSGAQSQSLSDLLIMGVSPIIDLVERMRTYDSIDAVAIDFGTNTDEYRAANLWLQQTPQPARVKIGRWAKTAAAAQLRCGGLSAAQQAISAWNAVTTGAFQITIDGTLVTASGLDFSAATNLNGVAGIIQTAVAVVKAGSTVVWNAAYGRFEFQSGTTGATSTITFLSAPVTGTDISGMLAGLVASSGAYVSQGQAAETAAAATAVMDAQFGQLWYALIVTGLTAGSDNAALLEVSAYIEAATTKHIHGITTTENGATSAVSTTDIAYLARNAGYLRTVVQYSSSSAFAVASLLGRILTTDYTGNNTVITLMYKQEPGVTAEALLSTQMAALTAKNANVFVEYNNDTSIIEPGVVASGEFLDTVTGTDALAIALQNACYNELYTSTTKVPQTDAGNQILVTAMERVCQQFVDAGVLAAGTWQSQGFGTLKQGAYMPKGYYIYAPRVSSQAAADRAARKSVRFQIAGKLAGAIHTVDVGVSVNR